MHIFKLRLQWEDGTKDTKFKFLQCCKAHNSALRWRIGSIPRANSYHLTLWISKFYIGVELVVAYPWVVVSQNLFAQPLQLHECCEISATPVAIQKQNCWHFLRILFYAGQC